MYYQHILEILRKYDPHFDEDEINQVIHLSLKSCNSQKSWAIVKIIISIYPDSNSIITALLFFSTKNSNFKSIKLKHSLHGTLNTLTKLFEIHNTHSNFIPQNIFQLLASSDCNIAIRVLLIRFAYLLHNITSNLNISYWVSYEISKIYLPLFQEVTVEKIKIALQNFCFQILHPQLCTTITSFLNHTYKHYDQSCVQIIDEFHNILSHMNIAYLISGRTKSPYSIAQKIIHKSVTIEQLYDVIGIRIIVEKKEECYNVLNTIYKHYLHIPHRYKDLITSPRKNGYQSLHAVIKTKNSLMVEVQIRTKIMHNIAEHGSASHLQYKMGLINISQLLNKYMLQQLTIISMLHSSISYSDKFFAQLFINQVSQIVLIHNGLLKINSEDKIFISILSDNVISNSIHIPKNSIMINTNVSKYNDNLDNSAIVHDMSYDIFASNITGTSTPKFHHTDKINMHEVAQKLSDILQKSDVSKHNDNLDDSAIVDDVDDMSYDIFASNITGTSTPKFHHTDKINMHEVAQKLSDILQNSDVSKHNDNLDDSAIVDDVDDMSYDIFASNITGTSTPKFHHTDKINMHEVAQKLSDILQNSDVSKHNDNLDDSAIVDDVDDMSYDIFASNITGTSTPKFHHTDKINMHEVAQKLSDILQNSDVSKHNDNLDDSAIVDDVDDMSYDIFASNITGTSTPKFHHTDKINMHEVAQKLSDILQNSDVSKHNDNLDDSAIVDDVDDMSYDIFASNITGTSTPKFHHTDKINMHEVAQKLSDILQNSDVSKHNDNLDDSAIVDDMSYDIDKCTNFSSINHNYDDNLKCIGDVLEYNKESC